MNEHKIHDVWSHVIEQLSNNDLISKLKRQNDVTINRKEYEIFCKEFTFDKLKGVPFGEAFCKRFNIQDRSISQIKSDSFAKELIEKLGYIK